MPISLGLDATATWQAAALAAQLGGSQANISAHLTRLKQSGLITSRAHGRAVYYRLTQPELGALLQTAGQLLAPIGQRAAEENDTTVRKTQRTNR
jgi:DNA-binding transcriptional ArsR family regulator